MFQILNQEHIKEGEGGFPAQEVYSLILSHESQKQLKTNLGQDVIAQNACSVERGGKGVTGCRINRGWMGLSVEGVRICQECPELNAD